MHRCFSTPLLLLCLFLGGGLLGTASNAQAETQVRLQLRWEPQFQFAGFYVALRNGYYRDAGRDVEIVPAVRPDSAIPQIVASYFQSRAVRFFTLSPRRLTNAEDLVAFSVASVPIKHWNEQIDFLYGSFERRGTFSVNTLFSLAGVLLTLVGVATLLHFRRLRQAVARARTEADKQTLLALSRKELLEAASAGLPVGLLMRQIPADGEILFANSEFRRQFGLGHLPLSRGQDFYAEAFSDQESGDALRERIEADIASGDPEKMRWNKVVITNDRIGTRLFNGKGLCLPDQNLLLMVTWDVTEEENVRAQLAAIEKRYRQMYQDALVAIWDEDFSPIIDALEVLRQEQGVIDLQDYLEHNPAEVMRLAGFITINDVNEATLQLFGAHTKAELIAGVERTFHPSAYRVFQTLLLAFWNREERFTSEVQYISLQGRELWVQLAIPLPSSGADPKHIPVTMLDITPLRETEDALRQSESRYADIYNNSNVVIWEEDYSALVAVFDQWRQEGVADLRTFLGEDLAEIKRLRDLVPVRSLNRAGLEMFAVDDLEELGRLLPMLWSDDTYRTYREIILALWEKKSDFSAVCSARKATGAPLRVRVSGQLPQDEVLYHSVPFCLTDITQIVRAEQEMQASLDRYEGLFRNATISLWEEDLRAVLVELETLRQQGVQDLAGYMADHPEESERFRRLVYINDANKATLRLFGIGSVEELREKHIQLFTKETFKAYGRYLTALWDGESQFSAETQMTTLEGKPLRLRMSGLFPRQNTMMTISLEDLTAFRQQQETLNKLSLAIDQSSVYVVITDAKGIIEYVNPALLKGTGYTEDEVIGRKPSIWKSGYTSDQVYCDMWEKITSGEVWSGELYNRRKNGEYYWELATISPLKNDDGVITHFIGIKEDISQLKEQEMQLVLQAHYDELTGLPNRTLAIDRLKQAVKKCQREPGALAVFFVDLDYFKDVNDSLGHDVGDTLLVEAASRIKHAVRASDTVGRFGGDEFLVLIEGAEASVDVEAIAQKINNAFIPEFTIGGHEINISCSIGVALLKDSGTNVQELLKAADTAMYKAKGDGRNTYHFFAQTMSYEAKERLLMETRLRQAMVRDDLFLHYQPLVRAEDGSCVGTEVLMRWQDSEMGLVPPSRFIPLAEDIGKIIEMGDWALRKACVQTQEWISRFGRPLTVSVNVSPRQLYHQSILASTQKALQESGLPPECLVIEVTEGLLIQDHRGILECLQELKQLGVILSVDDFGTGYSSLSYLKKFPFDTLKIDRAFVGDLESEDSATLVKAILAMADGLGLKVVGEGVEEESQWHYLREHGCTICQGYYFSRPVEPEEFEAYLTQNRKEETTH